MRSGKIINKTDQKIWGAAAIERRREFFLLVISEFLRRVGVGEVIHLIREGRVVSKHTRIL